MAVKIPVVVYSGELAQLQSGDSISSPITGVIELSQTNDEVGSIVICAPVYNDAADGVKKGKADASGTSKLLGLVNATTIASAAAGMIATSGIMTATTAQWDAVAGTTGGLAFGTYYYLSAATAGLLTATAPSTAGQYVVQVGVAISTTELKLQIQQRILL